MPNIKSFFISIIFFMTFCLISFYGFSKGYISRPYFYESIIFLGFIFHKPAYAVSNSIFISFFIVASIILLYYFSLPIYILLDIPYFQLSLLAFILFGIFILLINMRHALKASFLGLITLFIAFQSVYFVDKKISQDRLSTSIIFNKIELSTSEEITFVNSNEFRLLQSDTGERIVIVVWEALGVPYNKSTLNSFNIKFPTIEITEIETKPRSTMQAEFNILCNSKITQNLDNLECLPKKYQYSKAYHGNNKSYFSRGYIYPKLGFKEFVGKADLVSKQWTQLAPTCSYAYTAICDSHIFTILKEDIRQKKYDLLYFLTIDSHWPFGKYTDHQQEMFQDLELVIESFLELNGSCDCSIYILGDHPPIFASQFHNDKTLFIKI